MMDLNIPFTESSDEDRYQFSREDYDHASAPQFEQRRDSFPPFYSQPELGVGLDELGPDDPTDCTENPVEDVDQRAHWSPSLTRGLLRIMKETKELHREYIAGNFTFNGWERICSQFNSIWKRKDTKSQLQGKWKNLKRDYNAFRQLLSKSGWGWDAVTKQPTPPYVGAWDEVCMFL